MRRTGIDFSSKRQRQAAAPAQSPAARLVVGKEDRYAVALDPHRAVAVGSPELLVVQGDRRRASQRDMNVAVGGFGEKRRGPHVPRVLLGSPDVSGDLVDGNAEEHALHKALLPLYHGL